MARTVKEIQESLQQSVEFADPTIETRSGPVYNIMLQPVSNEVAKIELEQQRVGALYSLKFQDVATEDETEALATNFGIQRAPGSKSSVVVYFYTYTRPTSTILVRRGSLVSNRDGTLQYVVQEDAAIDPGNAASFYNAIKRTYEVAVNAKAISPGSDFDLPAYRINTLVTPNVDFDGVENRSAAKGGSAEETQESEVNRIRTRFAGLNTGSIDGVRFIAADAYPELVQDVAIVQPTSELFKRVVFTPGLDVYIVGSNLETVRQNYVGIGGETQISILSPPAVSSSLVLSVNGTVDSGAVIVKDTGVHAGTTLANDKVLLSSALSAGDVVTFSYSYNRLIEDVQAEYTESTSGDSRLFDTSILVFEAVEVPITVQMSVRVASSFDVPRTTDQIQSVISDLVEQETFGLTLFPETIKESLLATVPGISSLTLSTFTETNNSLRDVEIIELKTNEIPVLDSETFQLSIR